MTTYSLLTNAHVSGYGWVRGLDAWTAAQVLVLAGQNAPTSSGPLRVWLPIPTVTYREGDTVVTAYVPPF